MKILCLSIMLGFCLVGCRSKELQQQSTAAATSGFGDITMCTSPPTTDTAWYASGKTAPLLPGLEGIDFIISSTNPEAVRYFRQGLMLAYGFNHAEAARSFYEATRRDSTCAICYWGYSYVLGPNYNAGMEPDNFTRAYEAIQNARRLAAGQANEKEQALIEAMVRRYPAEPVEDRSGYDQAYAEAMKAVHLRFPEDPDIGAMYAEALMDLHPWDLWQASGQAQPWTPEILQVLENTLKQAPKHAGANHFYVHAVEAAPNPEMGNTSAQTLETLVPGAGHLVHMPSHIYINTGEYHKGTVANLKAVQADSAYTTACHAQGAYPLAYYPHNYHFMAATATLEGDSKTAMMGAEKMAAYVSKELMKHPGWATLQHYYTIPYNVAVKFGQWDKVLQMRNADTTLAYPAAVRHYARGMAWLGKKDIPKARQELSKLQALGRDEGLKDLTIWGINNMHDLVQIAQRVLEGEIKSREGDYAGSIKLLGEAVTMEDRLNYNEPPDWFFSVRHHLGAVLLDAGMYEDAIQVYEQDLEKAPKNGWALNGLYEAYAGLGNTSKAQQSKRAFEEAWQWSDTKLVASRVR